MAQFLFKTPYSKNAVPKNKASFKAHLSRINRKLKTKDLSVCNKFLHLRCSNDLLYLYRCPNSNPVLDPNIYDNIHMTTWYLSIFLAEPSQNSLACQTYRTATLISHKDRQGNSGTGSAKKKCSNKDHEYFIFPLLLQFFFVYRRRRINS